MWCYSVICRFRTDLIRGETGELFNSCEKFKNDALRPMACLGNFRRDMDGTIRRDISNYRRDTSNYKKLEVRGKIELACGV